MVVRFEFFHGAFGDVRFAFRVLRYEHVVDLGFAFIHFSGDMIGVSFLGVSLGGFEARWFYEVGDSVSGEGVVG